MELFKETYRFVFNPQWNGTFIGNGNRKNTE